MAMIYYLENTVLEIQKYLSSLPRKQDVKPVTLFFGIANKD